MSRCLKVCSTACAGLLCVGSHANAAIMCEGQFQIVNGMAVSTPFCQDESLSAAARKRGIAVSGTDVRRSIEVKREVCTAVASANDSSCAAYLGD
jgi:hypothetical protein